MTLTTSRPLVSIIANPAVQPEDLSVAPRGAASTIAAHSGSGGGGAFLSREHIIDAAEACFVDAGYDGTTIRAIAARLGCAVGSIYRYFTDKRQLLLAVAGRMFDLVIQPLRDRTATFDESLATYLASAAAQPQRYRLLMWLAAGDGREHEALLPGVLDGIISGWSRLLGSRQEAERIWASVHGMLMLGHTPQQIIAAIHHAPVAGDAALLADAWQDDYTAAPLDADESPVEDDVTLL